MENIVKVVSLHNQPKDLDFWLGKSEIERLIAGEQLSRNLYGLDENSEQRIHRVIEVTKLKRGRVST